MTYRTRLTASDIEALRMVLEAVPGALISLLVDHSPSCVHRAAAERVMAIAKWTHGDLAEAYVRQVQL